MAVDAAAAQARLPVRRGPGLAHRRVDHLMDRAGLGAWGVCEAPLGDLSEVPVPTISGVQEAQGPYLNLEENHSGRWTVTKQDTRVRAIFTSTRSPVQYFARQGPRIC